MSLHEPEPPDVGETSDGTVDHDELEALLGETALDREEHVNAPAFVVRPDDVQEALSVLRDEAGFDYLSNVTAQQYADRYESIYHLKKYDDPTQEVGIVVPTPTDKPVSQSAEPVYRTADWHEREAYDLVGVEYDDHPDMRRILLPETWQGHPLGLDYNPEKPQVVPFREQYPPHVRMPPVFDPDQIVGLPLVPVGGPVDGFGTLAQWLVGHRRHDDADLLCRIVVLLEVVDRLVAVGVLLGGDVREVVEPGLPLERFQRFLHFVGSDDERRRVDVVLAIDRGLAEQRLEFVVIDRSVGRLADVDGSGVRFLQTHGESAQLYRMTRSSSSISSARCCTNSSRSRSPNSSNS